MAATLRKPVRAAQLRHALGLALRMRVDDAAVGPPSPDTSGPGSAELAHTGVRVLVAEDNPVNQRVAVLMLERLGLDVDVASDGEEVLRRLRTQTYALIFMDCQMPELDGFEATARLRAGEGNGRRIPIVAMTASAMPGDRERCLAAGMDDYIKKPVRMDDLRAALERWLPRATESDEQPDGDREVDGPARPGPT
jgi:CheY-like chemotaxis protein